MRKGGFTYRGTEPRPGVRIPRLYQGRSPSGRPSSEGRPLQRAIRRVVTAALAESRALAERRRRNVAKLLGYSDPKWLKPGEAEGIIEAFRVQGQPGRFDD